MLAEEDDAIEQAMLVAVQAALYEVMELEEPWVDARALEASWVYITININEYHLMGSVFRIHFRMSREVFELLVQTVGNHLRETRRLQREKTPVQDLLLMVVWILATPDSFRSVALKFGRRPTTVWHWYAYVIEALRELAPRFITWPNAEEREVIKQAFQRASGFPGAVGCIDCTHVYISAPVEDAAHYVNRHDSHSMNVQCVVDHQLLVRHLYVGEPGSMHDRRIFRRSPLCRDLLREGQDRLLNVDEHLLGDGGYVLTDFMMIPFPNDARYRDEYRGFNRSLSQCRARVENAFARAKGKWRRLKYLHARNPAIVVDHIIASFVLHNFTLLHGEQIWEEDELRRPINNNQILGNAVFDDEDEDLNEEEDEERWQAAEMRGVEKRVFLLNHLQNLDFE